MLKMKAALEFIDKHPRIILLMAWPVFTLLIIGLILIIWKGPWIAAVAIQLKQLDILGTIALGVIGILAMNQLAQSSTFFGKLGLKLGSFLDMKMDNDEDGGRPDPRFDPFEDREDYPRRGRGGRSSPYGSPFGDNYERDYPSDTYNPTGSTVEYPPATYSPERKYTPPEG